MHGITETEKDIDSFDVANSSFKKTGKVERAFLTLKGWAYVWIYRLGIAAILIAVLAAAVAFMDTSDPCQKWLPEKYIGVDSGAICNYKTKTVLTKLKRWTLKQFLRKIKAFQVENTESARFHQMEKRDLDEGLVPIPVLEIGDMSIVNETISLFPVSYLGEICKEVYEFNHHDCTCFWEMGLYSQGGCYQGVALPKLEVPGDRVNQEYIPFSISGPLAITIDVPVNQEFIMLPSKETTKVGEVIACGLFCELEPTGLLEK